MQHFHLEPTSTFIFSLSTILDPQASYHQAFSASTILWYNGQLEGSTLPGPLLASRDDIFAPSAGGRPALVTAFLGESMLASPLLLWAQPALLNAAVLPLLMFFSGESFLPGGSAGRNVSNNLVAHSSTFPSLSFSLVFLFSRLVDHCGQHGHVPRRRDAVLATVSPRIPY